MLDGFMIRAACAGVGVALACAPLGCFVAWRRMAYYGDATAHAALLGVALSLALDLPLTPAIVGVALAMAAAVSGLSGRQSADAMLGCCPMRRWPPDWWRCPSCRACAAI